jgi:hypothetical protein
MASMDPQKTDTEEFQQIQSIGFKKDIKSCPKIASFFLCWLDLLGYFGCVFEKSIQMSSATHHMSSMVS